MIVQRNRSIDTIKGWGIIAVVIGHILLGNVDENILRYLIYSFHMPLFFFVSGFLLNVDRIGSQPLSSYLKKYVTQMLGWWILAWFLFTSGVPLLYTGNIVSEFESIPHFIIRNMVYPWGHLWFVPALFSYISLAYGLKRFLRIGPDRLVVILFIISVLQMLISYSGLVSNFFPIRYHNLLFFTIGLMCKRFKISWLPINGGVILCLYIFLVLYIKYMVAAENQAMCNFAILLCLIVFVIAPIISHDRAKPLPMVEWMGRNSLHIYLWHEIPIIILMYYFKDEPMTYYSLNILAILLFVGILWIRKKVSYSNTNIEESVINGELKESDI